jgi:CubicO group peptidase (beta-lactamase class C family)
MRSAMFLLCIAVISPAFPAKPDDSAVDKIFPAYDKPASPGCSLGVIRDGSFVYRRGYGEGSLELAVSLTSESVFYMGSVSKQFTAASIVILEHRGLLSLDDDVHKYIPELPDYGHPITLREMLHHTSGFRDYLGLLTLSGRDVADVYTFPELLDLVTRQKGLNFTPGDKYSYSNTNYLLLAEVVHRVSKEPLSEFAQKNIFQPLHMTHTRFFDDRTEVVPGRVAAYEPGPKGDFLVDWSTNFDKVGDGGLMSSVDDLLRWDQNFYDDKLADGSVMKELQVRGRLNSGKEIDYALGLQISDYRGLPTVEHGGNLFGYNTELLRFPKQRFTVICLCNVASANAEGLARRVADLYLASDFTSETGPPVATGVAATRSAFDPAPYAGSYEDASHDGVRTFVARNGRLGLQQGTSAIPMIPVSLGRFTLSQNSPDDVNVAFEARGTKMRAIFKEAGEEELVLTRVDTPRLSAEDLLQYAGNYTSTELHTEYRFTVEQMQLVLHNGWSPPLPLSPLARDEFNDEDSLTLVFTRDPGGKISGFEVFKQRAKGMIFTRR